MEICPGCNSKPIGIGWGIGSTMLEKISEFDVGCECKDSPGVFRCSTFDEAISEWNKAVANKRRENEETAC